MHSTPDTRTLTASPNVLSATLGDEAVLLDLSARRYFQLNDTGREIWEGVVAGCDHPTLVAHLVERFDVAPADAAIAVGRFLDDLRSRSLAHDQ